MSHNPVAIVTSTREVFKEGATYYYCEIQRLQGPAEPLPFKHGDYLYTITGAEDMERRSIGNVLHNISCKVAARGDETLAGELSEIVRKLWMTPPGMELNCGHLNADWETSKDGRKRRGFCKDCSTVVYRSFW
jgi:hypothetical protein